MFLFQRQLGYYGNSERLHSGEYPGDERQAFYRKMPMYDYAPAESTSRYQHAHGRYEDIRPTATQQLGSFDSLYDQRQSSNMVEPQPSSSSGATRHFMQDVLSEHFDEFGAELAE